MSMRTRSREETEPRAVGRAALVLGLGNFLPLHGFGLRGLASEVLSVQTQADGSAHSSQNSEHMTAFLGPLRG